MAITSYPTAIVLLAISDEGAGSHCPHCDAKGRYVYYFKADDGNKYGAMRGCFSLFPHSKIVDRHQSLLTKQKDYAKKEWKLSQADQSLLDTIEAYGRDDADVSLSDVETAMRRADQAHADWAARQKFRRY